MACTLLRRHAAGQPLSCLQLPAPAPKHASFPSAGCWASWACGAALPGAAWRSCCQRMHTNGEPAGSAPPACSPALRCRPLACCPPAPAAARTCALPASARRSRMKNPRLAACRCTGRVRLRVTAWPTLQPVFLEAFRSKRDVIDACLASGHLPFLLDGRLAATLRGAGPQPAGRPAWRGQDTVLWHSGQLRARGSEGAHPCVSARHPPKVHSSLQGCAPWMAPFAAGPPRCASPARCSTPGGWGPAAAPAAHQLAPRPTPHCPTRLVPAAAARLLKRQAARPAGSPAVTWAAGSAWTTPLMTSWGRSGCGFPRCACGRRRACSSWSAVGTRMRSACRRGACGRPGWRGGLFRARKQRTPRAWRNARHVPCLGSCTLLYFCSSCSSSFDAPSDA